MNDFSKESYIFHIDVNSAYLSWASVYNMKRLGGEDYRLIPSIVGGDPKKRSGIVLAKSIPAKACGIKTGETLVAAYKKCPGLKVIKPNYALYMKCSNAFVEILKCYTDKVQRYSVDEAFLDVSEPNMNREKALTMAYEIQARVDRELGFTVNVGVSSNKLLAKVASDLIKPNKVITLYPDEIEAQMWPLPVGDLFMVGRATLPKLRQMGIETIGDLARTDVEQIRYRLKSHGVMVWEFSHGIERSIVRESPDDAIKGIGNSTTIPYDVVDKEDAYMVLLSLTEMVAMRLRHGGFLAGLVSVSIRNSDLGNCSKQRRLHSEVDTTNQIYEIAKQLFDELWNGDSIRHLGVRVSKLCESNHYQYTLFDPEDLEKKRHLDKTIDDLRLKFGKNAIMRSCFLHSGIKSITGGVGEVSDSGDNKYPVMSSIL